MSIFADKMTSHVAAVRSDASCWAAVIARDAAADGPFCNRIEPAPAGGSDTVIRFAIGQGSLGLVLVAASGKGICAILLGDDSATLLDDLHDRFPHWAISAGDQDLEQLLAKVIGFVESPACGLDWPLDIRGTAFQRRVWQALSDIPPGTTVSYADIARRIGSPKAVRAVARACAGNRIAVAIPCHRVVRGDGAPSGYRWGVARKQALQAREALR